MEELNYDSYHNWYEISSLEQFEEALSDPSLEVYETVKRDGQEPKIGSKVLEPIDVRENAETDFSGQQIFDRVEDFEDYAVSRITDLKSLDDIVEAVEIFSQMREKIEEMNEEEEFAVLLYEKEVEILPRKATYYNHGVYTWQIVAREKEAGND